MLTTVCLKRKRFSGTKIEQVPFLVNPIVREHKCERERTKILCGDPFGRHRRSNDATTNVLVLSRKEIHLSRKDSGIKLGGGLPTAKTGMLVRNEILRGQTTQEQASTDWTQSELKFYVRWTVCTVHSAVLVTRDTDVSSKTGPQLVRCSHVNIAHPCDAAFPHTGNTRAEIWECGGLPRFHTT